MDAATFLAFAVNGIVLAAILALAAIGLTLVYSILRLSNFAHGDLLTMAAYVVFAVNAFWAAATGPALGGALALGLVAFAVFGRARLLRGEQASLVAMAAVLALLALLPDTGSSVLGPRFLLGIAIAFVLVPAFLLALDRTVWHRLRRAQAGAVTYIVTSIGIALALRNLLAWIFGGQLQTYERPVQEVLRMGPIVITWVQVWTLVAAALLVTLVHVLLRYTRTGRALRAVADNMELARVTGVDVPRMIIYVWILAGILATAAGVLLALNVNVNPNLGWQLLLPIFAAVILGGIGSPYGAMLGALAIGLAMELSVAWWPEYRLTTGLAVLILTMLIRPQGILGVQR